MKQQDLFKRNQSRRITLQFKIGDKVFKRSPMAKKYDDQWLGPYFIKDITNQGNTFKLENDTQITTANIKQIRLA
jgi:hypothetical protein